MEPRVKRFERCHLVEIAAVDEPHFIGITERRVGAVERRRRRAVYEPVRWIVAHAGGLVLLEALRAHSRAAVGHDEYLEALALLNVLEIDRRRSAALVVCFDRELLRIK